MPTYNVGDFFLCNSHIGQPRYLGVIVQKNPLVDKDEPRLLILSGIRDEPAMNMYAAGRASLYTQDRLSHYILKIRNQNSHEDFDNSCFPVVFAGLGHSTPTCFSFEFQDLIPVRDKSSLEDAIQKLKPFWYGANPEHIIRFFQRIHNPLNTLSSPNLSL